jgi:Helicase conserved C-terminal domain/SNF2-related domain/PLD-like domain
MATDERTLGHVANDAATGPMERRLVRALERVNPDAVRIATAYLTPDGFMALKGQLESVPSVQLLLGERPFLKRRGPEDRLAQPLDEEHLAGPSETIDWYEFLEGEYPWILLTHDERRALLESGDETATNVFSLNSWEKVRALVQFLQRDGVELRRYLADKAGKIPPGQVLSHKTASKVRLHAKSYLFRGASESFAAVGSSNLTKGGLTQNIELNLASFDQALVTELEEWFGGKWLQGQDCKGEFIKLLEQCVLFGRHYTPWQVFIKALDAAYGRYLDLTLTEDIAGKLAEFQQEAVMRCIGLLERHWGAMLCDSVGLGKTYEGLGILSEFTRRRQESSNKTIRALVICPAQLEKNWSDDKFSAYGILGETVTMESLPMLLPDEGEDETPFRKAGRERKLHYLQRFDIVLVDESHNFRNPATKRYKALQEVIRGGGVPDKRVVLLTATPINNTPWDLYNQLSLITRSDDTWYAGRGPISNLRSTFRAIEKGGGGPGLLDAMLLSLVRRTRHDIRALQEAGKPMELNGEPMRFPVHEIPKAMEYSLEALYSGIYREIIGMIEGLSFAVYDLEEYGVKTEAVDATTEGRLRQRNRTFIGIMKTIFLKRMESSVTALTSTVRTMVDYLDLFLRELDERKRVVTPKDAQRLRAVLGGSLTDDALESGEWATRKDAALKELPPAPPDAEERDRLTKAVKADREKLGTLLARLQATQEQWEKGDDPKLLSLRKLLDGLPDRDEQGVKTKAVIFTNYKDTADYIFRRLGGPPDFRESKQRRCQSNLGDQRWMAQLTGADDQKRRLEILSYFAPLAFNRETEPPDDPVLLERVEPFRAEGIDLLIATDVLSEGQNLQDAQYVINYDLPWNPVRIIQRAGRIDRLFSPHERVFIYNLMPERQLEDLLKLVKRLTVKVASIEDMVGLDASVLGETIEEKSFDQMMKLAAGGEKAEEVYREGEKAQGLENAFAELNKYVQMVKDLGTEEVKDIPDGVCSIRMGTQAGVFMMLRMPEELSGQTYWRFYPLGEQQALTTATDVIKLIDSNRDDERQDLPDDQNPFKFLQGPLQAAIDQLGEEYKQQMVERTQDEFTKKLSRLLARDDVMQTDADLWAKLHQWRQDPPPTDALTRPKVIEPVRTIRQMAMGAPLDVVVPQLQALWDGLTAEGLDRPFPKPEGRQPTIRDLELVCWELVVKKAAPGQMVGIEADEGGKSSG